MTSAIVETSESDRAISVFASEANFSGGQRMAKALASSSLVPKDYQGNIANVLIAMELASRIGCSVISAMQNLDVIHGRPSWRASFLIATVNASGRFTPLRFRFEGKPGDDDYGCRAHAKDRESGEECLGPLVSISMAKGEGWFSKNGSKWKTLPELMLMYRAAAFWTRVYAPELSLGMSTGDEVQDVVDAAETRAPTLPAPTATRALEAALLGTHDAKTGELPPEVERDPVTGEAVPPAREPGVD